MALIGGAVLGVVGQGISDLLHLEMSSWQTYVGAAVGGAAAGETFLYTGSFTAAGGVGSGLGDVTTQLLTNGTVNWAQAGVATLAGMAGGKLFGAVAGRFGGGGARTAGAGPWGSTHFTPQIGSTLGVFAASAVGGFGGGFVSGFYGGALSAAASGQNWFTGGLTTGATTGLRAALTGTATAGVAVGGYKIWSSATRAAGGRMNVGAEDVLASARPGNGHKTFRPGPFAGESIPARSPAQVFTSAERAAINRIGQATGCHTCGTTNPGTRSGNFVPDHQPPSALNILDAPQQLYPHCIDCSREQGLAIARQRRGQ